MKINLLLLLSFIFTVFSSCNYSSEKDWLPTKLPHTELPNYVTKKVDNIKYTVHSSWSIGERNQIISDTKKWLNECKKIVNEVGFNDSLHIFIARNREEMKYYCGSSLLAGLTSVKDPLLNEDCIFSIYDGGKYNPLKHELIHFITYNKWGYLYVPNWLSEGIATFSCQEYYNCDGLTLEERYAYLLQTKRLLGTKGLMQFISGNKVAFSKAAYNQSAYLVGYLINNFGMEKLKELWITGSNLYQNTFQILCQEMKDQNIDLNSEKRSAMISDHYASVYAPVFEKIYGVSFDCMVENINKRLIEKYPKTIEMDWEEFGMSCVE